MRILKALAYRPVRLLWAGQVFSSVGDEVYGIALVWFAAQLIGLNAGYVSAIQSGSIFIFGMLSGIWVDHRDHRRTMIVVDIIRGLAMLALPLFAYFHPLNLWVLIPVAILVSSLSAVFNPALLTFMPQIIPDKKMLQASNGLMETSARFARVIGPGFVSLLSQSVPLVHFFTVNAFTFFASAVSISKVKVTNPLAPTIAPKAGIWKTLSAGTRLAFASPLVSYMLVSGVIAGGAWMFILPLGMTLLIRERMPLEVSSVGMLVFAYGVGNIISNLGLGSIHIERPGNWFFTGRLVAGVGFGLLSVSTTLPMMMVASAIAAVGGPMNDLGFINLIQSRFQGKDLLRVYRLAMTMTHGGLLVTFLISPRTFKWFSVPTVISACAVLIFASGFIGFLCRFRELRSPNLPPQA